jgi:hypothetical protein
LPASPALSSTVEKNFSVMFWDRCYDLKNTFTKKIAKKVAFFTQNKAKLCKILINIGF